MRSWACVACAVVLGSPPAAGAGEAAKGAAGSLTPAQAEALVREVSATVERLRRLRFKTPVAVEIVDSAAARQDFESQLDDAEREKAGHLRDAWVHIGLVPAGTDLVAAQLDTAEKEVVGYYQSKSKTFRLLSHVSERELRSVMAHELTHALEDQHYDLASVMKRATNDDHAVAIKAVIEGSAMVTTLSILRTQGGIGKAKQEAAHSSQARARTVQGKPTFVQMQQLLPYTLGFSFLLRGKPWELLFDGVRIEDIEQAYADPPHSTREVLHPEQYWGERRQRARSLSLPDMSKILGPGWSQSLTGSVGELGLTLLTGSQLKAGGFEMLLPVSWETPGASGTAGDVYQHYTGAGGKLTVLLTRWESVRDADEFQRNLRGGQRTLFRFGANLLMLMGDFGDKGEALAAESARSVKYWAGE